MKNKILALILSVVMIAGVLVFPVSSADGSLPFKDVKEGKWFYKSVRFVYENGYMNGITNDTFDPNGNLTRGMVVTILCRMDGGTPELTGAFSDVAPKKWYAGYVGWAAKNKLVNGYSDGTWKDFYDRSYEEGPAAQYVYFGNDVEMKDEYNSDGLITAMYVYNTATGGGNSFGLLK